MAQVLKDLMERFTLTQETVSGGSFQPVQMKGKSIRGCPKSLLGQPHFF